MPEYSDFALRIQVVSILVRAAIGGDLAYAHAPNDPLFYAIHVFIDSLWSAWQLRHPITPQYSAISTSPNDILQPFGIPVSSTLQLRQTPDLCYVYADYSPSLANSAAVASATRNQQLRNPLLSSTAATNLFPPPNPTPPSFFALNNIDITTAQAIENEFRTIHTQT
ncbi:hypothetical protein DSO57_1001936 [Entomophthora muscae]|uniref:Uncharacterized protein n=1 Tax=Entomophthora muscae TaxID=34485 RepID=A0ACC2UUG8_9FUNG|nr:hypothetical protein DSO57_1001936 [Entomophthora muscae]